MKFRSSHFSFNSILRLGFTLAALSELTREVFLPDQSVRILEALPKLGKWFLSATLRKFVQDCAKVLPARPPSLFPFALVYRASRYSASFIAIASGIRRFATSTISLISIRIIQLPNSPSEVNLFGCRQAFR